MTVIINGTTGITTPGLTNDGSQTITGGTANGVAYLNGSKVLTPGQDIADQPQKVQDICNAAWTPEVIAAYKAQQAANQLPTAE